MIRKSASHRFGLSTLHLLCALALMFGGTSAHGQKKGSPPPLMTPSPGLAVPSPPSNLDQTNVVYKNGDDPGPPKNARGDNCFLPPLNALRAGMVGVADLQVPAKTQREYEDGCAALRNKKMGEAEKHLRKAVNQYAGYSAAWVLLGQVLEARQKTQEARDACSQPLTTSAGYLPAYLCLTDISARLKSWDEALKFSTRALEIDPSTDAAAYAYHAAANLNLHHLPEAERSALKASEIGGNNADSRVHFLLAQIYAAKGDRLNETAQLREYLKYATDPEDAAMVKNYLAQLEGASR